MKAVHSFGPLWCCVQSAPKYYAIQPSKMRMVEPPYKWGRGIRVRWSTLQIEFGLCRRKHFDDEYTGLLAATEGHDVAIDWDEWRKARDTPQQPSDPD